MNLKFIVIVFSMLILSFIPVNQTISHENIQTSDLLFSQNIHTIKEPEIKPLYTGIKGSVYHCSIAQCDSTPFNTATGYFIDTARLNRKQLRIVALSQDLIKCYRLGGNIKYGQKIYIDGPKKIKGWWTVRDCMPSYRRNSVDFLQPEKGGVYGSWKGIKIYTENPYKKNNKGS